MNHPPGLECTSDGAERQASLRWALGVSHGVGITVHYSERTVRSWIAGILGALFIVEFKIDKAHL